MHDPNDHQPELVDLAPATTAVIRGEVPMGELPAFFDRAFGTVAAAVTAQGAVPTGAAFARYLRPPDDTVALEVGFTTDRAVEPSGEIEPSTLPGGRVARLVHVGAYDELGASWGRLSTWVTDQGLAPAGPFWEVYVDEPQPGMDPSGLRTELFLPVG